ncbi:hypothetical protein BKA82DRAFT_4017802 [Pisolithus tinctorius]|nr:hypothetical protein BKA82DRAFT_4017802 [Pisolithus tinctorius]
MPSMMLQDLKVIETKLTSLHALTPVPQIKVPVTSEFASWPTPDYPIAATTSHNLSEVRPGSSERVLPVIGNLPIKLPFESKDSNTCVDGWVKSLGPSVFEALDLDIGLDEDCTEGLSESTEVNLIALIPPLALCEENLEKELVPPRVESKDQQKELHPCLLDCTLGVKSLTMQCWTQALQGEESGRRVFAMMSHMLHPWQESLKKESGPCVKRRGEMEERSPVALPFESDSPNPSTGVRIELLDPSVLAPLDLELKSGVDRLEEPSTCEAREWWELSKTTEGIYRQIVTD